jgi:integrase
MSLCRRGRIWHYDFWHHGQRRRGSTEQTGLSAARKVEALLMLRAREHKALIRSNRVPILSEFAIRFLQWVKTSNLEPNTKRYYEYGWRMLTQTKITGTRLDQVTTDMAETLRFPGSASNGNVALRTLRRMLKKAVDWEVIQFSPRIKLLKEHGREILIDPPTEAKLLAAAKQPLRDVIVIMQDTGMRPQDVFRLRWEHINWWKRMIFIPYGKTKNSRRYVPLSTRVCQTLELRGKAATGWVFPSRLSKSGHITNVAKQWIAARQAAGLDVALKLYCCRHTFATDALERTGNLAALMKTLGHADAGTAMRYQHPGLEQIQKAVEERNREHAELLARSEESPHKSPHNDSWVQ